MLLNGNIFVKKAFFVFATPSSEFLYFLQLPHEHTAKNTGLKNRSQLGQLKNLGLSLAQLGIGTLVI
jgi:hypothetical protein